MQQMAEALRRAGYRQNIEVNVARPDLSYTDKPREGDYASYADEAWLEQARLEATHSG